MIPTEILFPYMHKILLFAEGGWNDGVRVEQAVSLLRFLITVIEKCPLRASQLIDQEVIYGFDACVYSGRLSETYREKIVEVVNEYWLLLLQLRPAQVSEYLRCFYNQIERKDVYDVRPWLSSAFTNHCRTCEVCEKYHNQIEKCLVSYVY